MSTSTKRFNPGAAKAIAHRKTEERPLEPTDAIEPTTDSSAPDEEQQDPNSELSNLVQSVKTLQETALDELQQTMDDLAEDFTARAVAIVRRGTEQCFLQASQQIRQMRFPAWTSANGDTLAGNTIDTLALPGNITDGDTE
jgi:hypothetical protein